MERLNLDWKIKDIDKIPKNKYKVFSCFCCGGGSTMGYKLAGFNVLGGVEIDPKIANLYKTNHNPKLFYNQDIRHFNDAIKINKPQELLDLDILDGSPPCSSFSMAGSREKDWGKNKKFREGQEEQILDDLFFNFIETARILQPKIVVAENVKGLLFGKAKGYVKRIFECFNHAGYETQLFLLNASRMGVPQRRERSFFIAKRKDLKLPKIKLEYNEDPIKVITAFEGITEKGRDQSKSINHKYWLKCKPGESFSKYHPKGNCFNHIKLDPFKPAHTITGNPHVAYHWETSRILSKNQLTRLQTFPDDYNFIDQRPGYVTGMSAPPFMSQRIAEQIKIQLLDLL